MQRGCPEANPTVARYLICSGAEQKLTSQEAVMTMDAVESKPISEAGRDNEASPLRSSRSPS